MSLMHEGGHADTEAGIIRRVYDRRAPIYDVLINVLSLYREKAYREEAVKRLGLREGHRVLDLGCGTGLNFRLIEEHIGEKGFILGVDASAGMLAEARKLCGKKGYTNVSLVTGDVSEMSFREDSFDAFISTYLFSTVPEHRRGLGACLSSLKKGGRFVLADDILPAGWFAGPVIFFRWLLKYGWRNNWREIADCLRDNCQDVRITRHHFGLIYIISAVKP